MAVAETIHPIVVIKAPLLSFNIGLLDLVNVGRIFASRN